ncbi:MAG: hypothetical protein GX306_13000 [Clostridiales bacterium]|nr:hypothetical protein [Clostridiales bacterium]
MIKGFTEDFRQYAGERCNKALTENAEYMTKEQNKEADQNEVQADAELICYLQGYRDAINIMNGQL